MSRNIAKISIFNQGYCNMLYRIFTLHPDIFTSFVENSLIARGIAKEVIQVELVNWREKYGQGNYKQVDDKPFGGGSGMVLMAQPIFEALKEFDAISRLYKSKDIMDKPISNDLIELDNFLSNLPEAEAINRLGNFHKKLLPNNSEFEKLITAEINRNGGRNGLNSQGQESVKKGRKVTVSLTPRGYPINQRVVEWLSSSFDEINILCGRYEGFDARVSDLVDVELSLGNFVTNGGEVPAMALIEATARLLPEFITKNSSVLHDSYSSGLNQYAEHAEFIFGKKKMADNGIDFNMQKPKSQTLFEDNWWLENVLPNIEHPQYTRPTIWQDTAVPPVVLSGDHKKIQAWRAKWY